MKHSNCEINILIKGKAPATEYRSPKDGLTYIEGRDGSEFEVEVINHNPFRVEAVISVDGLSVIDGKAAGNGSSGYLIEANSRVVIPGWKVDNQTAAKFVFTGKKGKGGSYVEAIGGDATNKGVIGAMVFRDRPVHASPTFQSMAMSKGLRSSRSDDLTALSPFSLPKFYSGNHADVTLSASSMFGSSATMACADSAPVAQNLGTGFGEASNFSTTEVNFDRGDMIAKGVLFYDDAKGLAQRGIDVSRRAVKKVPDAFPGNSCQVPDGWSR